MSRAAPKPTRVAAAAAEEEIEEDLVVDSIDPEAAHWMPQGLALQLQQDRGVLCAAKVYRWIARKGPSLLPSVPTPTQQNDDKLKDKAEPPVAEGLQSPRKSASKSQSPQKDSEAMDVDEEPAAAPAAAPVVAAAA